MASQGFACPALDRAGLACLLFGLGTAWAPPAGRGRRDRPLRPGSTAGNPIDAEQGRYTRQGLSQSLGDAGVRHAAGKVTPVRLGRGAEGISRYGWLGFIAQAGVSLGLAQMLLDRFPEWGGSLRTLIIAVIAINQLIGPIGFRFALIRTKEARV